MRHQRHKRQRSGLMVFVLPTKSGEWKERRTTLARYDQWVKAWRVWWHKTGWKLHHSPEMWQLGPIKFREVGWGKPT